MQDPYSDSVDFDFERLKHPSMVVKNEYSIETIKSNKDVVQKVIGYKEKTERGRERTANTKIIEK